MKVTPMRILHFAVVIVLGLLWLLPVYLLVANAAKTPTSYSPTTVWQPPSEFGLIENMQQAWQLGALGDSVVSTAIYAVVSPLIAVIIGAMAGFAVVALRLKNGFAWFMIIFGGTVFPLQMVLMPLFDAFSRIGAYDTRWGMLLIYTAISVPFSAFVMRNFFSGVAHSIFEAARVDGASTWRIFLKIHLPLSLSALVAVFILQATFIWNDFLLGLTLSQSDAVRPIVPALSALQGAYGGSTMNVVLAGGLLISLPTVVLFLATQRFFARGLSLGQY